MAAGDGGGGNREAADEGNGENGLAKHNSIPFKKLVTDMDRKPRAKRLGPRHTLVNARRGN